MNICSIAHMFGGCMVDNQIEVCNCGEIHSEELQKIRTEMPDVTLIHRLADFFKILGDPTRITIVFALLEKEMCVCDIATLLNMSKSSISHQLKTLKIARLVKYRRSGKTIFYSLDDRHIDEIVSIGVLHTKEGNDGK